MARADQIAESVARKQAAVEDVVATLMDWFPHLTGEACRSVALVAVAACERAGLLIDGSESDV